MIRRGRSSSVVPLRRPPLAGTGREGNGDRGRHRGGRRRDRDRGIARHPLALGTKTRAHIRSCAHNGRAGQCTSVRVTRSGAAHDDQCLPVWRRPSESSQPSAAARQDHRDPVPFRLQANPGPTTASAAMTVAEGLQAQSWLVTLIKANGRTWQVWTIR